MGHGGRKKGMVIKKTTKQKPMLDGIVWENRKHLKRECKMKVEEYDKREKQVVS